jgi:streptogramin lyase
VVAPSLTGSEPAAIAVGLGSAWIVDAQDGNIYRVDPQTGAREPIEIGAPLAVVAIDEAEGSLWIGVLDASG